MATRQAAEKEKKEREAAEKAKRRRPVSGPGSTNTSLSSPPPIPRKSPPPSLAKVFEEGGVEWNAVEGKKFATMGAAQLRETFAHRDLKKHRENASKFSADLMKKRETATRLRPKVAYGDITPINAQAEKEKFLEVIRTSYLGSKINTLPTHPDHLNIAVNVAVKDGPTYVT